MSGIQIVQLVAILLTMLAAIYILFKNYISILIVLPILGILIAGIAGVDFKTIIKTVIGEGAVWGKSYIIATLFGGMFGYVINKTGIAKEIIRKVAEMAGSRKTIVAVLIFLVTAAVFTGSSGMGGVIAVGTISIPLLIGMGIRPIVASIIFLMGMATGGAFSVVTWEGIHLASNISYGEARSISMIAGGVSAGVGIIFILVSVTFARSSAAWAAPIVPKGNIKFKYEPKTEVRWFALLAIFVPLIIVFMPVIKDYGDAAAVISLSAGTIYALLTTKPKKILNALPQSFIQGAKIVLGPIGIFIGLGILIKAIMLPETKEIFKPIIDLMPTTKWGIMALFVCLSPLALYRGPFNRWGLGIAIFGILSPAIGGVATAYAIWATGALQGVSDPTNTANIWTAGQSSVSTNKIMVKSLPFTMLTSALTMLIFVMV